MAASAPVTRADLEGWGWFWRDDLPAPTLDRYADVIAQALRSGPMSVTELSAVTGIPEGSVRTVLTGRWRWSHRFYLAPGRKRWAVAQ